MNRREQETILGEVLGSEEPSVFRKNTLDLGLASLRARRRRRVARFAVLAVLFTVVALILSFKGVIISSGSHQARETRVRQPQASLQPKDEGVKLITDEDLFALFPNRPMALIGKPGHQQLVFLGQRADNSVQ